LGVTELMSVINLTAAETTALRKLQRSIQSGCFAEELNAEEFQAIEGLRLAQMVQVRGFGATYRLFITDTGCQAVEARNA